MFLSGSPTRSLSCMHAVHYWSCLILLCKQGICRSCHLCHRLLILHGMCKTLLQPLADLAEVLSSDNLTALGVLALKESSSWEVVWRSQMGAVKTLSLWLPSEDVWSLLVPRRSEALKAEKQTYFLLSMLLLSLHLNVRTGQLLQKGVHFLSNTYPDLVPDVH